MLPNHRVFGDIQEGMNSISLTIPFPDYLRKNEISVDVSKRSIQLLKQVPGKTRSFDDSCDEEFKIPRDVVLRPETCTISMFKDDGLYLRMQTAKSVFSYFNPSDAKNCPGWNELLRAERSWISEKNPVFCCSFCGNPLTMQSKISRVLELPSENWYELFESSAWCHNHSSSASPAVPKLRIAPKSGDCLTSDFFFLINLDQVDIDGVQIEQANMERYDGSHRKVQTSEILCNRCQNLVGYLFWDMDHSGLENDDSKSRSLQHKEYVKLYKHCLTYSGAESGDFDYLAKLFPEYQSADHFVSPFIGTLLSDAEMFEVVMAQFFKHQAEESFYRFLLVADDAFSQNKEEVLAVIRLLTLSSKIIVSDESVSLPDRSKASPCDSIWYGAKKSGHLQSFSVLRLTYLERRCVESTPGCQAADYKALCQSWKNEITGVSKLHLPISVVWKLFQRLNLNSSMLPQHTRIEKASSSDCSRVFKIGFLRLKP